MNLPNKLTLLRVFLVPLFVFFYLTSWIEDPLRISLALVTFVVASLTDTLDGYLARKNNEVTDFGKFMDPLADKLLVCSAFICFTESGAVPAWATVILIGREFVISGFRLVAAGKGVVIAAGFYGKLKTIIQMVTIISLLLPFSWDFLNLLQQILIYASVALTLISVADYIWKNKQVLSEGR